MSGSPNERFAAHTRTWRLEVGAGPNAPAQARREVAALALDGVRSEDVALLVSEAVTNAVRHGAAAGGQVVVEVGAAPDHVRIRVLDGGRGTPVARAPGADGGYGLQLIDTLATRWGAGPGEIWFELAR